MGRPSAERVRSEFCLGARPIGLEKDLLNLVVHGLVCCLGGAKQDCPIRGILPGFLEHFFLIAPDRRVILCFFADRNCSRTGHPLQHCLLQVFGMVTGQLFNLPILRFGKVLAQLLDSGFVHRPRGCWH